MKITYSVGVDIGGTNTDIGMVSSDGKCIARSNIPTSSYYDIYLFVKDLVSAITQLMQSQSIDTITGIGVGAPNGNYYTGCIDYAPNLNFKGKIFLKDLIQTHLNVPVRVSNDANAAAYGEMIYGGAKNMRDFIMITLGTGVGSGIVINGQLVNGYDGNAGELGHTIIFPGGRLCNCGRRGCLEQYTSARGIAQTCIEFIEQNSYHGVLSTLPKEELGCKSIAAAAHEGDPLAVKVFECTGYILGLALSNAVAFSSPEAIFLMGGPLKAGELLLSPLRRSFDENLLAIYKDKIKILESELKENEAAILGAAALTK